MSDDGELGEGIRKRQGSQKSKRVWETRYQIESIKKKAIIVPLEWRHSGFTR